ncbi:putative D-isomer specific 2-hydroxyacid dehydrogenase-protein [Trypanosoma cruzi]|uniref:D-isomer specific 2-hydroxyacid dehydrogenase-protein, putative n=2 Tax=Trypanosoma cruzi TaxID=5693 RepID=Q4CU50_TRYCC|nr:D-isomer specific 2-hydroxyacid dehydrogenase-protein, putative [Trypanosoma cruzi]EAN83802.1 D-isomer specific 2-hydroxyacid dehydrogenase-protein, putative [Trypanosoma cruzi]PWV16104.1 putative D-isomer specific 2-hydroxyacid dehydrogenase-protein [Trypanosoma cruzi]|eukprot:XP_805653.1 D-isomer specific 2-hydroxyacid dehydrogenase-protein [Trypanosoma cruzi strain CL Brener]
MNVFDCTLCVATTISQFLVDEVMKQVSLYGGFRHVVRCHGNPQEDFMDVKQSGEPIVLLIANQAGREALKFLCDDYHLPKEQRRVLWIHSISSGLDSYKLNELVKELQDIPLTNARGCYSSILAEHVMYSMLYFYRQTWRSLASRAEHKWDPFLMVELRGRKVGIIGYGDIGRASAKLLSAFGMEVTGVKRSASTKEVDEYGVRLVHGDAERERVLRESDFVVNILPGTEETKRLFNKELFSMMKPSAVYINIGRGITQNEDDLACALRDGVIRGASVDVFEREPLPAESPLWDISDDKILLTYHNAVLSDDFCKKAIDCFMLLARDFGSDGFASNVIQIDKFYCG